LTSWTDAANPSRQQLVLLVDAGILLLFPRSVAAFALIARESVHPVVHLLRAT
jgi:hypothetical protein